MKHFFEIWQAAMNLTLLNDERLIHSFKIAVACLIGFLVADYVHFHAYQWIIITILVVMCGHMNVGSMIQKSYMRFLGTIAGSIIAISTLYFFGAHYPISIFVITSSAIFFSFIATSNKNYSESGTLGVVTVTIILIAPDPTLSSGFERFLEISLGILIAALVSQFIFPIHAETNLRRNQATTLRKLHSFYHSVFANRLSVGEITELRNLDEEIAISLIAQRKLASEAKREYVGNLFNLENFRQSLWLEKEILRSIIFMYYAYHATLETKKFIRELNAFQEFNQHLSAALEKLALCIEKRRIETIFIPNITTLKQDIQEKSIAFPLEQKIYLDSFLFCSEALVARLNKLAALINAV
jgi:uncharacterized membrane protein YccC